MSEHLHFKQLVASGQPVGEIIAVDRFLVKVNGLQPITIHTLVMFEDGSKGFVQYVLENHVLVLHLGVNTLHVGMVVVAQHDELVSKVGKDFVGRVISVTGEPLDGKGAIAADKTWPVFAEAPMLYKREQLNTQLETGVMIVDALMPLVHGQRLALLGDSKSGKSTLAAQVALSQRNTDTIVIYVLIAKRRSDVDALVSLLTAANALQKTIVVVATLAESLVLSYLAPYVGCSLGEYLWQSADQDVLVIYDDLTSHAQVYREISLLSNTSPGRDSYPGDIFYAHASLLERAGKLRDNHKSLTALPVVLTPGDDIAAYLPTNVMSITDGQWVLDMKKFRNAVRPALNVGLSVTRVGGRGHNDRQRDQNQKIITALAAYEQAEQYAHFGSDIALNTSKDLVQGQRLYELFIQKPSETYNAMCQQLMLDVMLNLQPDEMVDVSSMKSYVVAIAEQVKSDADFEKASDALKTKSLLKGKAAPAAKSSVSSDSKAAIQDKAPQEATS